MLLICVGVVQICFHKNVITMHSFCLLINWHLINIIYIILCLPTYTLFMYWVHSWQGIMTIKIFSKKCQIHINIAVVWNLTGLFQTLIKACLLYQEKTVCEV